MEPDEHLVEHLRSGDRAAFDVLYERYFPRVFRFVDKRLSNRADVEETVQEVFISIFNSIDGFRGEAPFGAWVFGLTRRTIASRFKRKRHETVPLLSDEGEGPVHTATIGWRDDPYEAYEFTERLARMEAAIADDLTPEQWELFRLHHLENRTIQDIARSVAKSEDSVKSHLYRARRTLMAR